MRKLSVLEFEKFCERGKYTQFIFNTSDQPEERIGMGNCNCVMRFAAVHAFPCPDTVYFSSKYKDNYVAFSNVIGIEVESDEKKIANEATIICKSPDGKAKEERYLVLVNKTSKAS